MSCPCEVCKTDRDLARQRRQSKKAAAQWHERQLRDIEGRLEASKDAEWCKGDGNAIRVQAMSGSHLFYAIAKGYRGEYPPHYARSLVHLENEALRRLIKRVH
jgi:hypothetical protein